MTTSAQVFKMLVIFKDNGPSQDYYHLDDQTTRPCEIKKKYMLCIFERGGQRETHTVHIVQTPNTVGLVASGKTFVYYQMPLVRSAISVSCLAFISSTYFFFWKRENLGRTLNIEKKGMIQTKKWNLALRYSKIISSLGSFFSSLGEFTLCLKATAAGG